VTGSVLPTLKSEERIKRTSRFFAITTALSFSSTATGIF